MPLPSNKTAQVSDTPDFTDFMSAADTAKKYRDVVDVLRKASATAPKIRGAMKGVPLLSQAAAAIDIADLAASKKTRDAAIAEVEQDAQNAPAIVRATKGFFDPFKTAYGIGKMVSDLADSTTAAKKAAANAPSDEDIAARYLEARRRAEMRKLRRNDKGDDYQEKITDRFNFT
jgi:hypothetical protein